MKEIEPKCIKFIPVNNSVTVGCSKSKLNPKLFYSLDKNNWEEWNGNGITIQQDQILYVKGDNPITFNDDSRISTFTLSDKCRCEGNIMGLLGDDITEIPHDYCFAGLFVDCANLVSAPELPAMVLKDFCYTEMFKRCTSLTTAPELPAMVLREWCYMDMFRGCTSLTTAPSILPATTLVINCYRGMFRDCSSLNNITILATDISASTCLMNWVDNVSPTGTFTKKTGISFVTGVDGIPSNWTVIEI